MAAIWNTFLRKDNQHTPVTTPKPVKMHDCGFQSSGFHLIEINVANTTFGISAGDLIWGIAILLTSASILYCLYKKFDIFKCVKDYRRGGSRDEDVEMASDRSRKVVKRLRKMGPNERKSVLMEFEKKKESPPVIVQVGEGLRVETKNRDREEESDPNRDKVFPSKTPWQDKH